MIFLLSALLLSTDLDILRNEYPDEEDSDDDGSYGGYCDEDGLATGVRGLFVTILVFYHLRIRPPIKSIQSSCFSHHLNHYLPQRQKL